MDQYSLTENTHCAQPCAKHFTYKLSLNSKIPQWARYHPNFTNEATDLMRLVVCARSSYYRNQISNSSQTQPCQCIKHMLLTSLLYSSVAGNGVQAGCWRPSRIWILENESVWDSRQRVHQRITQRTLKKFKVLGTFKKVARMRTHSILNKNRITLVCDP